MINNPSVLMLAEENVEYNSVAGWFNHVFRVLKKGLEQNDLNVYWLSDKQSEARVSIGYNVAGIDMWKNILESGCSHIMWTVDSCFYHNFHVINEYVKYPNFHILIISKDDIEPLNYFFPDFKNYHYVYPAFDTDFWKYENQEKDLDIVYFASVQNPEEIIKATREKLPANLFEDFMYMFDYLKKNPQEPVWNLYKELFLSANDTIDKNQHAFVFHFFFKQLTYLLSYTKRIELVKSMEDVGIKIWGTPEWAQYISGKNEYMGPSNFDETCKILQRSKIALNLQPLQIIGGLHERVITATLSESAVLCDSAPEIKATFGDNLTYFDVKNFTNIKQKALTLLSNKDMREHKVRRAKEIILKDHTWASKASTIRSIIQNA